MPTCVCMPTCVSTCVSMGRWLVFGKRLTAEQAASLVRKFQFANARGAALRTLRPMLLDTACLPSLLALVPSEPLRRALYTELVERGGRVAETRFNEKKAQRDRHAADARFLGKGEARPSRASSSSSLGARPEATAAPPVTAPYATK